MRVAICTYDGANRFGGPFTWLTRILPELRRIGIDSHVLVLREDPKARCSVLQRLRTSGIAYSSMPLQSLTQWRDNTENRVAWFLREVARCNPDVFITNMVSEAYYAARWVREAGIPTVGILHSDDDAHHALADRFVMGSSEYRLSAVVPVSKAIEEIFSGKPVGECLVKRIPCMVSVPDAVAAKPAGTLRLVYSGRLSEKHKRILSVGRAFCRAVREVPGTEAVFYGSGPQECDLRELLQKEGDGLPIRVAGLVPADDLQEELLQHHVIVLQSEMEGLPVSLAEGMACGLVPICRRIRSGVPELVSDGTTGLLVDDDGDGFVAAVRRLRENPDYWHQLSRNARRKALEGYSTAVVVEKWRTLFAELQKRRGTQRAIRRPRNLRLPPSDPLIEGRNARHPGWRGYVLRQFRRAGRRLAERTSAATR